MELPNCTINLHLEMEWHVSTMRAAMNTMDNRKNHKIGKMPDGSTVRIRVVNEGVMETDVKTRFDDQVHVITDVGSRYKVAEDNAMTLEAEIKSLEATASKAKRLMDSADKAQTTAKAAKDRARLLAEHMMAAVSAEAGKMEAGAPEPHDAADSVVTALKAVEAAKAATLALEALDKSVKASREVCALTTARISVKKRELGVIAKDKEAYHGLLAEEVHVGNALLDIMNGNRPGVKAGVKTKTLAGGATISPATSGGSGGWKGNATPPTKYSKEDIATLKQCLQYPDKTGNAKQDLVYKLVSSCTRDVGLQRDEVAQQLNGKMSKKEVIDALDYLNGEGYIYSTIDDDHFKAIDF